MRQLEYSLYYPVGAWTNFIRFSEEPRTLVKTPCAYFSSLVARDLSMPLVRQTPSHRFARSTVSCSDESAMNREPHTSVPLPLLAKCIRGSFLLKESYAGRRS